MLMAFYANAHRDPKKASSPVSPADLVPIAFDLLAAADDVGDIEERERRALEREAAYLQALALKRTKPDA